MVEVNANMSSFCQRQLLENGWRLGQVAPGASSLDDPMDEWIPVSMPEQVHQALERAGRIRNLLEPGAIAEASWVAESDWVYRLDFSLTGSQSAREGVPRRHFLLFEGLDTVAKVYLNGQLILEAKNMFRSYEVEISHTIGEINTLIIHFPSIVRYFEDHPLPESLAHNVERNRVVRKPHEDFNAFNGAHPYHTTVGIFGPVRLIHERLGRIESASFRTRVTDLFDIGELLSTVATYTAAPGTLVGRLLDPSGQEVTRTELPVEAGRTLVQDLSSVMEKPQLWWPLPWKEHPLYSVEVTLTVEGETVDQVTRSVGFRHLVVSPDLDVHVNGERVRLWGANLTPIDGRTHTWPGEAFRRLMRFVKAGNINTLRAWGPGTPYDHELYEYCDREGLLLWSELNYTWGLYPMDSEYVDECLKEAEEHILRYQHHPSVFLWCGGNENEMSAFFAWENEAGTQVEVRRSEEWMNRDLFYKLLPDVFYRLDPERFYHPNSPSGGAYPNDPRAGDSHTYNHIWFVPGQEDTTIFTENTRISIPPVRTLRRVFGDDLGWDPGFTGASIKWDDPALPGKWLGLTLGKEFIAHRIGPVEEFFDADGSPESFIYRVGSGHARYLRRIVELLRRGRDRKDPDPQPTSTGHIIWKLNNSWPSIYSNIVDYFQEPNIAYYALRRAYAPVLISIVVGDSVVVWVVNDGASDLSGILKVSTVDTGDGSENNYSECEILVRRGHSQPVMSLDSFGMFPRQEAIWARIEPIAESIEFATTERRLKLPNATVTLKQEGEDVVVTSSAFVRSLELRGSAEGDAFGWHFEDNYFDLIPSHPRRVKVLGHHKAGRISAVSIPSPIDANTLEFRR